MEKDDDLHYVKTINGNSDDVRKWLLTQNDFVNRMYVYLIDPVNKNGKRIEVDLHGRMRNPLLDEYKTKTYKIYKYKNESLNLIENKKPFLDMGARSEPHPYATDAVEIGSRQWVNQQIKENETESSMNLSLFKNKLNKDLNYHFKFNYNKKNLPYEDNHFEIVYSRGSMSYAATPHAYQEVYRVLKKGGQLILETSNNEDNLHKLINNIKQQGFKNVTFKQISAYSLPQKKEIHYNGLIIGTK